jgi:hypothetical protein
LIDLAGLHLRVIDLADVLCFFGAFVFGALREPQDERQAMFGCVRF